MSRIGNTIIKIPASVTVQLDLHLITVKGPKGQLQQTLHPALALNQQDNQLKVSRKNDTKLARSLHGTFQRLIHNMVIGVTDGFNKHLELVGTGYRVAKQGSKIVLSLGFSHPIEYNIPSGIDIKVEGNNKIIVEGIDKQQVGQVASTIRSFRKPEPYKGKGIKYDTEIIRRKSGKAAKTA